MIPSEVDSVIPKSVLRYVWSIKVLKAGLGFQSEQQVRAWFHNNPAILAEFDSLNEQLINGVRELQERAISGLKYETINTMVAFNSKRKRLE